MTRRIKVPYIVGLDLSLTGTGICMLPPVWEPGDWLSVYTKMVGYSLPKDASEIDYTVRLSTIASSVIAAIQTSIPKGSHIKVFIEQYAYNMAMVSRAHRLGEIGGVVKMQLLTNGYMFESVPATTARKLLLGTVPRKDQKKLTVAALRAAGANLGKEEDRYDAFVIANHGRAVCGLPALTLSG